MRRAARVDANQREVVRAFQSHGCSVTLLHRVGEGCPDLLIGLLGQTLLVEVKDGTKSPSQQAKTPAQVLWWSEWKGGPVATINDLAGVVRVCAMLRHSPHGAG
jgi:Holliday junction resolvase